MKNLIYAITLFAVPLFFGGISLLGIDYQGGEKSSLYRNYCILIFIVSMGCFFLDKSKQIKSQVNSCFVLAFIYYILVGYLSGNTSNSTYLSFIAFALPSACIGMYYANDRRNTIFLLAKWIDIIFVFLTVSSLSLALKLTSEMADEDANYSQRLSYFAALCFLLDIFLLFYGNRFERFGYFRGKIVNIIYYCLLPLFFFIVLYSGGRGGFVVIVVGTIAIAYIYNENRMKGWLWGITEAVAIIALITLVYNIGSFEFTSNFDRNIQRVFSYISSSGIDVSEISGRDIVYEKSLELFVEKPVLGYGLFSYKRVLMHTCDLPYPHNLFLEWLLQGGFLFFFIWFCIFCKFLIRMHRLMKSDRRYLILLPFFIHAIVQLMFTGSYMGSTFFWFALSFVLNKRVSKNE